MSGGLELVKWIAFAAMVADHVDLILLDRSVPWLNAIGRFAYPAFAVAFGLGLARSTDPLAVARRLLVPGLVAQVCWLLAPGGPALNVLLSFASVAFFVAMLDRSRWHAAGALVLVLCLAPWLEGGPAGLLVASAAWAFARFREPVWLAGLLPMAVALPSVGLVAGLAAPWIGQRVNLAAPRVPGLLAWAYAAHLAALVALRAALH